MAAEKLRESYWPADISQTLHRESIGEALYRTAASDPERIALVEVVPAQMESTTGEALTDRRWTYAQLRADGDRCASWLLAHFTPGDHICVWAPNVPEWIILQYGAALAGMVLVTANPALRSAELRFALEKARAKALFHTEQFRGVDMGAVARGTGLAGVETHSFHGWLQSVRNAELRELPKVPPEHPAQIQYTSGTTGEPKGALLHQLGLINNARYFAERAGFDRSVLVSPMPLFHTAGSVMSVLGCLTTKSTLVLPLLFEPKTVLSAIEREHGEVLAGVPTMLLALIEAQKSERRNLTSLRVATTGGAPVPPELHHRVKEAFGITVLTVFGQTEASPVITQTDFSDPPDRLIQTSGKPLPNVEVRVVDPVSLDIVAIGVEGEIQARGYQVMLEYFGSPEATSKAVTPDGWLRTGDLGAMDEHGFVQVTGRLKDMIIRGGENIYPAEIEACLLKHPRVLDVAVFGAPDNRWGEIVAAAIRTKPGEQPTPDELTSYCREQLAPHKAPGLWFACQELPLTASGKVQKFRLREALAEGSLHQL